MATFDELLESNQTYVQDFTGGDLAAPPKRKVAVVTCMDARLHPERFLGFDLGDAHVIRNAGGRVTDDALRSLVISQRMLGTQEVIVIQHTECGMMSATDEDIAAKVKEDLGVDTSMEFLTFTDLKESVKIDVNRLRNTSLIPEDVPIVGAIYDVKRGKVEEVTRV